MPAVTDERQVESGSYFAYAIRHDASPIYGVGVRRALAAYHHYGGLEQVLAHVRKTGNLPVVPNGKDQIY